MLTSFIKKASAACAALFVVLVLLLMLGVDIMEWIAKAVIPMELDCVQYGLIGNTFSDMIAVLMALVVARTLVWVVLTVFKIQLKGEGSKAQQFIGVTVGCLLVFVIYSLSL